MFLSLQNHKNEGVHAMYARAKTAIVLLALCFMPLASLAQEADPFKACARCHGQDGNSSKPPTPSIAGLASEYIVASLQAYQAGSRQCGFSKNKCKMASRWTGEEITAASQHFSALSRVPAPQEFDADLAAQGKGLHEANCAECHSGTGSAGQGGLLHGQWREYLEYAMEQYRTGGRVQPEGMQAATGSLDDAQWNALLHFYASGS